MALYPYPKLKQRPDIFTLNVRHQLAHGLVFAGLQAHSGSNRYHDSSVFGDTGTLTESPVWVDDPQKGRCLQFTSSGASTGTRVVLSRAITIAAGNPWTWAMWVKRDNTSDYHCVLGGTAAQYRVMFWTGADALRWYFASASYYFSSLGVGTGAWAHVAGVYDGANANIIVNGVPNTPQSVGSQAGNIENIGAHYTDAYTFAGRIKDPMIWTRALSQPELNALADPSNVMLSGLILPTVRKWWPVSSGGATGTTIDCTCGAVTIAGNAVTISAGTTIDCTVGAVTVAGNAVEVEPTTQINCTLGTVEITGQAVSIAAGTTINCTLGTVEIASYAAGVSAGTTIDCTLATVELQGQVATVSVGTTISATAAAIVVESYSVSVSAGTTINCTLGTIVFEALAASISASTTIGCTLGTVEIAGHATTITISAATTADGIDYAASDNRPHYSARNSRPHYAADDDRPHYSAG